MNCKQCGAEVPAGSGFCRVCGAKAEVPQTYAPAGQQSSLRCSVCGSSIAPGAKFCNVCGSSSVPASSAAPTTYTAPAATPAEAPAASAPKGEAGKVAKEKLNQVISFAKDPKNRNILLIGLGAIALIIVVAILIGSISGGPMASIGKAVDKTIIDGNFTVEFEVAVDGEELKGEAWVDMNLKKGDITLYAEVEMDGDEYIIGIYEQELFLYDKDWGEGESMDISDYIDDILEAIEENKDLDLEELAKLIEDETGVDLEDYVDLKKFEKGVKKLTKKLNSKSWLKENAGYSTEKKKGATIHVLEPKLYDLVMASIVFFEDAIEDYDDIEEALEDVEDLLDMFDVTVEIGVKSNKLTTVDVEMEMGYEGIEISAEFTDVGKTKVDMDKLEDLMDDCD